MGAVALPHGTVERRLRLSNSPAGTTASSVAGMAGLIDQSAWKPYVETDFGGGRRGRPVLSRLHDKAHEVGGYNVEGVPIGKPISLRLLISAKPIA